MYERLSARATVHEPQAEESTYIETLDRTVATPLPLHFGVELELVHNMSRAEVAQLLTDGGIACVVGLESSYTFWSIVGDISIHLCPIHGNSECKCNERRSHSFEIVSPVLHGEGGLQELATVVGLLLASGATSNQTTGLHVHMDASARSNGLPMNLQQLKNIAAAWIYFEDVFDQFLPHDRKQDNNSHCQSNLSKDDFIDYLGISMGTENERRARRVHEIQQCTSVSTLISATSSNRSRKLNYWNLQNRDRCTLEFRSHSGTCDPTEVMSWIRLLQVFVDFAKDCCCLCLDDSLPTSDSFFNTLAIHSPGNGVERLRLYYTSRRAKFDKEALEMPGIWWRRVAALTQMTSDTGSLVADLYREATEDWLTYW